MAATILYLAGEDWFFASHFIPMARAARDLGFKVIVATRVGPARERLEAEGFHLVDLPQPRNSVHPLAVTAVLGRLMRVIRSERPEIIHTIALKNVVMGAVARRLTGGGPALISAITGFGFLAVSRHWTARLLRAALPGILPALIDGPRCRVLVENPDDAAMITHVAGVDRDRVIRLKGAGVDLDHYRPQPEPAVGPDIGPVTIGVVARMLWSKGVDTVVEAQQMLLRRCVDCRLLLVGRLDPDNPHAIPEATLRTWDQLPGVRWLGHRSDIPAFWAGCHIAVLASWREGLPKTLVEAAACGRAIITTDVPGCREIVRPEETGLLIAPHDAVALAAALERLINDSALRQRMGAAARKLVEDGFSEQAVAARVTELYRALSGRSAAGGPCAGDGAC